MDIIKSNNHLIFDVPDNGSYTRVLLKASLNNCIDFYRLVVKSGELYSLPFPSTLFKSGTIEACCYSIPDYYGKALRVGEHASPPKGYPTKRSEYGIPDTYTFPLDTKKRVHSAMAYFAKHNYSSPAQKKECARRILRAAHKYDIKVSDTDNVYKVANS